MRSSLIILLIACMFSCEDGETKLAKQNLDQTYLLVYLVNVREEGNCKKVVSNTNNTQTTTCSRKPRGFCSIKQSIITQGEINFLLSEGKKVRDRTSDCELSFLQSGLLTTTATTTEDEATIRGNTIYSVVSSCENDDFIIRDKTRLATSTEILFLESAKGRIGRTASVLSINRLATVTIRNQARSCLEKEFSDSERGLFTDLGSGTVLLEVSK